MEQGARAHTGKFTFEMLKNKKQLRLLETHQWLTSNSDLNPVDFVIWGLLVQELWRGLSITDLHLKKVIVEEWSKILQETIHKCIASFERDVQMKKFFCLPLHFSKRTRSSFFSASYGLWIFRGFIKKNGLR